MKNTDIAEMRKQEQNYWWHVSRRFILQSVLKRFLSCHSDFSSCHSGHLFCHSGLDPESRQENKQKQILPARSGNQVQDDRSGIGMTKSVIPAQAGIQKRTKTKILDLGCGAGINFSWLRNFGEIMGVDNNKEAVEFCKGQGRVILGDAVNLPVTNESQDLLTAFDLLEHLKDDKKALEEWNRVLKNKGYLFISVPAYQWLFGPHDKNLMHYRRYLLSNLLHLLKKAGFRPVFASYFFVFTFPVFVIQRMLSKVLGMASGYTATPPLINNFLINLGKFEAQLLRFIRLPFGSSILILVQKND